MQVTKRVHLETLLNECAAAGVTLPRGLGFLGNDDAGVVHTYMENGEPAELPAAAIPIVDAHIAPPPPPIPVYGSDDTPNDKVAEAVQQLRQYIGLSSPSAAQTTAAVKL